MKLLATNFAKNGQTYFKNLAVSTQQDFKSMFGHSFNSMNERVKLKGKKNISMPFFLKLNSDFR